jgi:hypothetical protein
MLSDLRAENIELARRRNSLESIEDLEETLRLCHDASRMLNGRQQLSNSLVRDGTTAFGLAHEAILDLDLNPNPDRNGYDPRTPTPNCQVICCARQLALWSRASAGRHQPSRITFHPSRILRFQIANQKSKTRKNTLKHAKTH